jgi:hypothetical protein
MQNKKPIIIIAVLSVLALGLGYWYGLPKEGSGPPLPPLPSPKEPEFLKKGLVAYYPFNGNAKDESGNGNDGEVNGATLTTDRHGKVERAYDFDGKDDLIRIPSSQSINAIESFGITFWVKAKKAQNPDSHGYVSLLTRWDQTNANDWFGIWLVGFSSVSTATWPNRQVTQSAPLQKEVWQHVVYTHDASGGSIYIDGELKSQRKLSIRLRETSIPIIIGADNFRSKRMFRFFTGQLDDIRIYNRALSEAEVKALYEFEKVK